MADLSNITREVTETNTVVESAIVLLNELGQLIRDNITDQAALDDLANTLDVRAAELAAAIAANSQTPPEEPPVS